METYSKKQIAEILTKKITPKLKPNTAPFAMYTKIWNEYPNNYLIKMYNKHHPDKHLIRLTTGWYKIIPNPFY